jgi:hypothetical protein
MKMFDAMLQGWKCHEKHYMPRVNPHRRGTAERLAFDMGYAIRRGIYGN